MDTPFETDGCSGPKTIYAIWGQKPVFVWACWLHDVHYWAGGTEEEKSNADDQLARRVKASGFSWAATAMKMAVHRFGGPERNTPYRWAYGWQFARNRLYQPLSLVEIAERDYQMDLQRRRASQVLRLLDIKITPEMEL